MNKSEFFTMITGRKIGVLMGGQSAEREVSLKSGRAVFKALQDKGCNVVAIDVASDICSVIEKNCIDVAFIVLHGGYGEDGSLQGLLEVKGIPYTGSGVLASALSMDKEASKKIFLYHNIPMPPFAVFDGSEFGIRNSGGFVLKTKDIKPETGFPMPWVAKPATEGSSVGVCIVKNALEVSDALTQAFSFGKRVIIEKYIKGKEVQIGILGNKVLGGVEVRPSLEFYSYEAKYTAGLTEYILPPEIDETVYGKAKDIALSAHLSLGCKGATRVDLIIDGSGSPYVLEVNTIPGMTETSLLPKIAELAGLDFPSLIEAIIKEALEGHGN